MQLKDFYLEVFENLPHHRLHHHIHRLVQVFNFIVLKYLYYLSHHLPLMSQKHILPHLQHLLHRFHFILASLILIFSSFLLFLFSLFLVFVSIPVQLQLLVVAILKSFLIFLPFVIQMRESIL